MNVNDVLDAVGQWDGDMSVVVSVDGGQTYRSIESIEWVDTDAGPMVLITPRVRMEVRG